MLKKSLMNILFTGMVQAVSLVVILYLASSMSTESFGLLSIQLSSSTVLAIICTLQFERVYVRVSEININKYIAFHLRILIAILLIAMLISINFRLGPSSVALAGSIAFSQIAVYSLARKSLFRRIWILKSVQGLSLLIASLLIFKTIGEEYLWLSFFTSYLCAGFLVFDEKLFKLLFSFKFKSDLRRCKYSQKIASISLASLLTSTFTRELPVLLCGIIGQPGTAGTIGLIMRIVGTPIGLIARSTSAVVASYVSRNKFTKKEMLRLLIVPLLSLSVIVVTACIDSFTLYISKFEGFTIYLLLLTPYLLARSYIGLLGPVIVYHKLQIQDLTSNVFILIFSLISACLVYYKFIEVSSVLVTISLISLLAGLWLTILTFKNLNNVKLTLE